MGKIPTQRAWRDRRGEYSPGAPGPGHWWLPAGRQRQAILFSSLSYYYLVCCRLIHGAKLRFYYELAMLFAKNHVTAGLRLAGNEITAHARRDYGTLAMRLRHVVSTLAIMSGADADNDIVVSDERANIAFSCALRHLQLTSNH